MAREKWEEWRRSFVSLSLHWTIHLFNGEGARVRERDRLRQMKGAVAQYTAEIAYRSRWQYSGALARAWEFSEGVNNQAAQLSCPIQQTLTPNHTRIPFLPSLLLTPGPCTFHPSFSALRRFLSLSFDLSISLLPSPSSSTWMVRWEWLDWQPIEES